MATLNLSPENPSCNTVSRRQALAGAAACGALALPAGAAVAASTRSAFPTVLPSEVHDPLIAMWAERQRAAAAAKAGEYGPDEDELYERLFNIEDAILNTVPTTPEGAAIVAAMLVTKHARWSAEPWGDWPSAFEPEDRAGGALARYILEQIPPDVLRRAGVEAAA